MSQPRFRGVNHKSLLRSIELSGSDCVFVATEELQLRSFRAHCQSYQISAAGAFCLFPDMFTLEASSRVLLGTPLPCPIWNHRVTCYSDSKILICRDLYAKYSGIRT